MTREEFYAELYALAEPDYRDFNAGLLPGVANILGVRMPALRRIAKRIAAGDWRAFLAAAREESYEETMVQALVMLYASIGIIGMLLGDLLMVLIDPRISFSKREGVR